MASKANIIKFASKEAMADRVADVIESSLSGTLHEKGKAVFAVSGGSTPAGLYRALSRRPIDWQKIAVPLVDERWVAPGSPGSNEDFVRSELINDYAKSAQLYGLWRNNMTPMAAASDLSADAVCSKIPDVVVLGLGNDGHTASWFPNADGLDGALAPNASSFTSVRAQRSDVTGEHLDRVSMSLEHVRRAKFICLLIAGEEKHETFMRAREYGNVTEMPVCAILRARPDLWACWAP